MLVSMLKMVQNLLTFKDTAKTHDMKVKVECAQAILREAIGSLEAGEDIQTHIMTRPKVDAVANKEVEVEEPPKFLPDAKGGCYHFNNKTNKLSEVWSEKGNRDSKLKPSDAVVFGGKKCRVKDFIGLDRPTFSDMIDKAEG